MFGIVYHARDTRLDRDAILKILFEQEDEEAKKQLINEGKVNARVHHPNIVNIYRVGEHSGYVYLVMEYVKGKSLDEILKEKGKLPWKDVSNYMGQLLAGLAAAHSKNIIHRDIKPGNIIIGENGRAMLTDFGLAKLTDQQLKLTATLTVVGTFLYMAPEQCQGKDLDERCDLYALGATMYEALTGHPPFYGQSPAQMLVSKINRPVPDISENLSGLSTPLDNLFHTLLETSRENRFQTADDVQEFMVKNRLIENA